MRSSLLPLQTEARALARSLESMPGQKVRIATRSHQGSVPRAHAGAGETFWQYRQHTHDDSADTIDWRRSARADDLFVREQEQERPRNWLFWFDPSIGFDWSSEPKHPRKAERAIVLIMAMADVLARSGERCGSLDGRQNTYTATQAAHRVGLSLWAREHDTDFPTNIPSQGSIPVIVSDFYTDLQDWKQRIRKLSGKCPRGLVVSIADPAEIHFPFAGHTRLFMPGGGVDPRLYGRIESIKDAYLQRFTQRRSELRQFLSELGWQLIEDHTDRLAHDAFRAMILAYADIRAS